MSIFDRILNSPEALANFTYPEEPKSSKSSSSESQRPARADMKVWSGGQKEESRYDLQNKQLARGPVGKSDDLTRILKLARRPPIELGGKDENGVVQPPSAKALALVELMMERLGRGERKCACRLRHLNRLNPAQAWALYEAPLAGGLIANLAVGTGKTWLNILMPMVMPDCKLAVTLIPPGLKGQLWDEYEALSEHFHVPSIVFDDRDQQRGRIIKGRPVLHVLPYSKLSRPESTALLGQLNPDLIIADELHKLSSFVTSTVKRFMRYLVSKPDTRFCGWSGTITKKSIKNYAHLLAIALGEGSPLPLEPQVVEEWATALDPSDWPAPVGALRVLCADPSKDKLTQQDLYAGYHARFVETRGVVTTKASAIDASLNMYERKPPRMPAKLAAMLEELRDTETRPDGEEFVDKLETAKCARELACGFYYRWKFPKGTDPKHIEAWFKARKAWHRELRAALEHPQDHLDSPMLLFNAAARYYHGYKGELPVWRSETWRAWAEIKDTIKYRREAVWVDDYLAEDCAAWAEKHRGLIWYGHNAFGERVAELSGLSLHGGGVDAEARIKAEKGDRSLVISLKAHGTGRNGLQFLFNEQLFPNFPASGDLSEQCLGRLHRLGQKEDEVNSWVYRHTTEMRQAVDRALLQAKYIRGTIGSQQKLLVMNYDFELDQDAAQSELRDDDFDDE